MKRIVPLLAMILVVSACKVRLDVTLDIAADESGSVEFAISLDQDLRDLMEQSGNDVDAGIQDNLAPGWTAEQFVDGDFEGTRATRPFTSLDDLRTELDALGDQAAVTAGTPEFLSQLSLTRTGDVFEFSADLTGLEAGLGAALGQVDTGGGPDPTGFLAELVDIRLVLNMPGAVTEHNADAVAASTLTWNLSVLDDGKVLMARSELGNPSTAPVILPILAVLIAAAVVIIVIQRRSARRKGELAAADASS